MSDERRDWLSLLAKADADHLRELWETVDLNPAHQVLRAPEIGAVMTRGRMGATGAPFNMGEITVTHCSVRLETGEIGHGYVSGRSKAHSITAALIDALMQTEAAPCLRKAIFEPLARAANTARTTRARKAAATRVDFFTMARGAN